MMRGLLELKSQIESARLKVKRKGEIVLYAKYTHLRSAVVFGGVDMKPQTAELKKGVEVLVATPGHLQIGRAHV